MAVAGSRLTSSTLAGALVLVLIAPCAWAQKSSIPRTPAGRPDMAGIWQTLNEANWNLEPHVATQGATETLGAIGACAARHRRGYRWNDSLPSRRIGPA